ncbi:uncharacterized protein [Euwallacea similis]|uniref:uncharacterized protein n=1 Tax=Euwallacea similis TaxID=1736056 RepID=UPI00345100B4
MTLQIHWASILLVITVFLFFYNITNPIELKGEEKVTAGRGSSVTVKRIVAYSLKKQIELEGEEIICDEGFGNIQVQIIIEESPSGVWSKVEGSQVYLTSLVALDKRLEPFQYLRAVAVVKGNWTEVIYCQILMNDGHVRIIKSTVAAIWYDKWDTNDNNTYYNPNLLSCKLPEFENNIIPVAVTFSLRPCHISAKDFHQILKKEGTRQTNFTLCVKPLNFKKDISLHMVQWIEMCRVLGAQFFHIFLQRVTKKTRRVLNWYKKQFPTMFHIEDFKPVEDSCQNCSANSFFQSTWQRRRYEVVSYNKCFYQNLNSKFIIPLDVDEFIVPKKVKYWRNLVEGLDNYYTSLIMQNVYFFKRNKNRSNKPFFLRELKRNSAPSGKGENGKSFISTRNALTVFNHYALHLLRPGVTNEYFLPFKDGQLNHYKESCDHVIFPECAEYLSSPTVVDNVIFKYKSEFYNRYNYVINEIWKRNTKLL